MQRRVPIHLCSVLLLFLGAICQALAQTAGGPWPPTPINGDPNDPQVFYSNGVGYRITYVWTSNTAGQNNPVYVNVGGTLNSGFMSASVNGRQLNFNFGSNTFLVALDHPEVPGYVSTNEGVGGLDRGMILSGGGTSATLTFK